MPPYQVGITSDDGNRVAQLLACDAEGAAPMIQAIDVSNIYPGREAAGVFVCCGQVHILLPFVGWADAHAAVFICSLKHFQSARDLLVHLPSHDSTRPPEMLCAPAVPP